MTRPANKFIVDQFRELTSITSTNCLGNNATPYECLEFLSHVFLGRAAKIVSCALSTSTGYSASIGWVLYSNGQDKRWSIHARWASGWDGMLACRSVVRVFALTSSDHGRGLLKANRLLLHCLPSNLFLIISFRFLFLHSIGRGNFCTRWYSVTLSLASRSTDGTLACTRDISYEMVLYVQTVHRYGHRWTLLMLSLFLRRAAGVLQLGSHWENPSEQPSIIDVVCPHSVPGGLVWAA